MLGDLELWLDAADEQGALCYLMAARQVDVSPAWEFVTAYYWSFFNAVAFTRLIGAPVVYLDRNEASVFGSQIGIAKSLHLGSYVVRQESDVSENQCKVVVKKSNQSHMHEAVWRVFMNELKEHALEKSDKSSSPDEFRFFSVLVNELVPPNAKTPSDVRNPINYNPLCRAVLNGAGRISPNKIIRMAAYGSTVEILEEFAAEVRKAKNALLVEHSDRYGSILLKHAFLVDTLVRSLYEDVADRLAFSKEERARRQSRAETWRASAAGRAIQISPV